MEGINDMIVKNAVWEKRNLGVESVEMEVEETDTKEEVEKWFQETEVEYIAIKIPASREDITFMASDYGYHFIEDMIFFEHDLKPIERSPLRQRLYDAVHMEPMDDDDMEILYTELKKGSFAFDRISKDPYFTEEQANNRFINWVKDEKERGAEFLKGVMKGKMIGFFCLREIEPGIYTSALGGTFLEYRRGGLGTNVQTPEEVKKRGGKKLILGVSSNNIVQIRALILNGFFPTKVNHVFVKHCK